MKRKKLVLYSSIYLISNAAAKGISFFLIPIYTRFFSKSDYGILSLIQTFTTLITPFVNLGLLSILGIFYFNSENGDEEIYKITKIYNLLAIIMGGLVLCLYPLFNNVLFNGQLEFWFYAIIISNIYFVYYRHEIINIYKFQHKPVIKSLLELSAIIIIACSNILFIVKFNMTYKIVFINNLIINIIYCVLVYHYFYFLKKIRLHFKISWDHIKSYLKVSLPGIWTAIAYVGLNNSDRIVLKAFVDFDEIGLYSLAYNFGFILRGLLIDAFVAAYSPHLMKKYKKDLFLTEKKNMHIKLLYFCGSTVFVIVYYFALKLVFPILVGEKFHDSFKFILPILIGYIFQGGHSFNNYFLLFNKRTDISMYPIITAFALNIILNIIFIPVYGTIAAAYTTLASFISMYILSYILRSYLVNKMQKEQ